MPAYRLSTSSPEGRAEDIDLDLDDNLAAVITAFASCSLHGHTLWRGSRFLGAFEPGDARLPPASLLRPPGSRDPLQGALQ